MATTIHRFAIGGAAVFAPLAIAALVLPAVSRAAEWEAPSSDLAGGHYPPIVATTVRFEGRPTPRRPAVLPNGCAGLGELSR
jgi:hypothetical protein